MGLIAKETGNGNYEPVSEGLHPAICYGLYDLGMQHNETFGKDAHKVLLCWELPEERIEIERDGEKLNLPRATSKQYTLSLHKKAGLRKDLETWRGRSFTAQELEGFDLQNILGINCMLQIIHTEKDGKTYANISAIIPLPKGMPKRTSEIGVKYFSFADNTPMPEGTPDWIVKIIKESPEWDAIVSGKEDAPPSWIPQGGAEQLPPVPPDDEIPF